MLCFQIERIAWIPGRGGDRGTARGHCLIGCILFVREADGLKPGLIVAAALQWKSARVYEEVHIPMEMRILKCTHMCLARECCC